LLQDRIQTALSHAQRKGESLSLMFLDLDRFKNVNDSLGHHVGDALLVQVAQRLKSALRDQDTVCRLGGDEFVILCPDTDTAGAAHVATKLLEATAARFQLEQLELTTTFSIGIAVYPQDGDSFETLSMRADSAMYKVKQSGRNSFRFFTAEMQAQSDRVLQLENALGQALEREQLHLVYQPQVSLHTGAVVGVEALLRWNHPALGNVSPAEFIPVAEDSGLIIPIGEWVLRSAARQMRAWLNAGMALQQMAVNLSAVQFRQANLTELVTNTLQEEGLPPHCLEVELTEGVAMNDPLGAIAIMNRLQQGGVRMSIDDFGTGYSSLNYLKRFNIYKLKIDQSFVRDITVDPEDKAIVSAIIGLARTLGFQTIAEGVETQGQLAFLREQGCDEVQGYFFSRPLPADQFENFMRSHNPDIALELSASHPKI
jgi:diguanylate cyclase (GGDEF)-like protein